MAVRGWMEYQYPTLHQRAQRKGAQIHAWGRDGPTLEPPSWHLLGAQGPDPGGLHHRAALRLQRYLQPHQPRQPALSGVRGQFHHRGVFGLSAPLGALSGAQGVFDCGPPFGAPGSPGAAVGEPTLGPARVVLPAALQPRAQPRRVLEPGHQGKCHALAATAQYRGAQASGSVPPAPTPAVAGEVEPFLLATPSARCGDLAEIYSVFGIISGVHLKSTLTSDRAF